MPKSGLAPFRWFSVLSLSFIIGVFIASFVIVDFDRSYLILAIAVFACLFSALTNFSLKNYLLMIVSFCFIFILLGLFYYSIFDKNNTFALPYDQNLTITGKIINKPDVNFQRQQVFLEANSLNGNERNLTLKKGTLLLVNLPHYPEVRYGDELKLNGTIIKPGKFDSFDYGQYLKRYLIFGVVNSPNNITDFGIKLNPIEKVKSELFYISRYFEESLNRILPEPNASLASGLILGIKRNIPDGFKNDLSTTGLTHIIALSGYNVTIIVAVFSTLLLGVLSRKQIFVFGTLLVLLFVVMTGAASSVVRAAIFSLLVIFGRTIGRQADFTNLLLLAALVMILVNPYVLRLDVGFQLSFLAFSGIIYLSPIIKKILERKRFTIIPGSIKSILAETLSAQIAVLPLILAVFGRVSFISPLANILVVFMVPFAMGFSFVAGFIGIFFYPIGQILGLFAWVTLEYIIKMTSFLAKFPFASISFSQKTWLVSVSLYLLIIIATYAFSKKYKISLV